ncbi:arsenate reductase (glutaredoxin) [Thioclava sp. GXIMD2076]|uniref:Arsenate reductase n=1 Tax=Thioclava kandeliae TaxID=3070818 RepID=A0ABV1SH08_9RHOB
MALTLWHNPRCSKSRETLALLQARGHSPEIRLYLTDAPSRTELEAVISKLGQSADTLVRWKDAKGLIERDADHDTILATLAENPKLIERPILITGQSARLGRPPEQVLEIL